ncbi:MAG: tyrosine-type recombinase/integrase [Actinomycetota bacterium]|jgi:integrase|nr:tyrosine-type recombinase/integrase [Actinomycetota bacterium]
MRDNSREQVEGPLARFASGIEEVLLAEGYLGKSVRVLMRLVAELSRWLGRHRLGAGDLSEGVVDKFFEAGGGRRCQRSSQRSLKLVVAHLCSLGVLTSEGVVPPGRTQAEAELLGAFGAWCVGQRGLTLTTRDQYVRRAATFLELWRPDGGAGVGELDGRGVLGTVRAAADVMPAPSLRSMVTALRSLLRFLYVTGRNPAPLASVVPSLKSWPRTALPNPVPAQEARQLVAACDAATGRGRRDAAVLLVLLRLGLRAGEVARLELGDIDWRRGEVTVRGKGGHQDVMPLPVEVGEAIAAYLRAGRPSSSSRAVFLTAVAPVRPLSSDGVALLVGRACGRAGVAKTGPHRLRKTLATETLRAGAPMAEVAQLLRHADQATSSIYAAADVGAVVALARPWPEVR